MALRILIAAALVAPSTVFAAPDPKPAPAERVTAREAVERQLAAAPMGRAQMSGVEAALIMEKYRARIGKMLEPKREIGEGRAER